MISFFITRSALDIMKNRMTDAKERDLLNTYKGKSIHGTSLKILYRITAYNNEKIKADTTNEFVWMILRIIIKIYRGFDYLLFHKSFLN